jgi:hypothetical protein
VNGRDGGRRDQDPAATSVSARETGARALSRKRLLKRAGGGPKGALALVLLLGLLIGYFAGILSTAPAHHLPHSGKPCQLVQIKYASGWSQPMTRAQARDRTSGHQDPRRIQFVPLTSSGIYDARHSYGIIGCLIAQRFHNLATGQARSVATCESHGDPQASNEPFENVYQTRARTLRMHQDQANLGRADRLPGGVDLHNGYGGIYGGLRWASQDGWGAWACA